MLNSVKVQINEPLPIKMVAGANINLDTQILYNLGKLSIKAAHESAAAFAGSPTNLWVGKPIRGVNKKSLPTPLIDMPATRYEFMLRHDPRIEWEWEVDEVSELTQELIRPIKHFYKHITRVKILMQIPGFEIPAHRDITPGNTYDNMQNEFIGHIGATNQIVYRGPKWLHDVFPIIESNLHAQQGYYALKIPIDLDNTDRRSYVIDVVDFDPKQGYKDKKIYYDFGGQPYWLNEYECLHGVDAGSEWRGVLFMDGILDMDAIHKTGLRPLMRIM
jgi:hypothetical protein